MKTLVGWLIVLVLVIGCVSCAPFSSRKYVRDTEKAEDEGIPLIFTPSLTVTEQLEISVLSQVETPTLNQLPLSTAEPEPVPVVVPTPEPTRTTSAKSEGLVLKKGLTFLGTQLDFLANGFGWGYETYKCAGTYVGVANVFTNDPVNCFARAYAPAGNRADGSYLFIANYWSFDGDAQIGKPFAYKLYLYRGTIFGAEDSKYYWAGLNGEKVLSLFDSGEFSDEFMELLKGSGDESKIPPFPQGIYPLTAEEYLVLVQQQELFPWWVEAGANR